MYEGAFEATIYLADNGVFAEMHYKSDDQETMFPRAYFPLVTFITQITIPRDNLNPSYATNRAH